MRWKAWEIDYLYEHAGDGAEAIANYLNRSKRAVECQATRYGISLRKSWLCPRCGQTTYFPLTSWSGWCRKCSVAESKDKAAIKNRQIERELQDERRKIRDAERERQALYEDTRRKKKKLRNFREV